MFRKVWKADGFIAVVYLLKRIQFHFNSIKSTKQLVIYTAEISVLIKLFMWRQLHIARKCLADGTTNSYEKIKCPPIRWYHRLIWQDTPPSGIGLASSLCNPVKIRIVVMEGSDFTHHKQEELCFLGYKAMQSAESEPMFTGTCSLHLQGWRVNQTTIQHKAGSKQSSNPTLQTSLQCHLQEM